MRALPPKTNPDHLGMKALERLSFPTWSILVSVEYGSLWGISGKRSVMEEGLRLRHSGKQAVRIALSSSKTDASPAVHSPVCVLMSLLKSKQQCQNTVSLNLCGRTNLHPVASQSVTKCALLSSEFCSCRISENRNGIHWNMYHRLL